MSFRVSLRLVDSEPAKRAKFGLDPGFGQHGMNPYERPQSQVGPASTLAAQNSRGLPLWFWLVLLGGGGAFLLVVVLAVVGMSMVTHEVCDLLEHHPVAQKQLGQGISCELELLATGNDERDDYFHYKVRGSKATGIAILHTEADGPDGEEVLVDGELVVARQRFGLGGDG